MSYQLFENRGAGTKAWLAFQSFLQLETIPKSFENIDILAQSLFAKFASYEVHDDLPPLDNDKTRRGSQSIWSAFGEGKAILFGNMLSAYANKMLLTITPLNVDLLQEFNSIDLKVLSGQLVPGSYSIDHVRHVHGLKTGSFFGLVCSGGAMLSGANSAQIIAMREFGFNIGRALQIGNDASGIKEDFNTNSPSIFCTPLNYLEGRKTGLETVRNEFRECIDKARGSLDELGIDINQELISFVDNAETSINEKLQQVEESLLVNN